MKILIAGMGNVLRGDDAFGIRVVQALAERGRVSADVHVYEAGIAGIPLVQELMNGFDALIVVDAVDRASAPGTLFVLEPGQPQPDEIAPARVHQSLVDAHYARNSDSTNHCRCSLAGIWRAWRAAISGIRSRINSPWRVSSSAACPQRCC